MQWRSSPVVTEPAKPEEDANWQRILSLPFQIVQKPGGAGDLREILKNFGPLLKLENLPMLNALARYYIATDAALTEKFALEAENIVNGLQGDQAALKVESTCELAVSYAHLGKKAMAENEDQAMARVFTPGKHLDQGGRRASSNKVWPAGECLALGRRKPIKKRR